MPPKKRGPVPPPDEPADDRPGAGEPGLGGLFGAAFGGGAGGTPSSFTPGFAPECMTCPFGLFLFAMRQARPEVTEHLMRAGQELFMALKAFMDQAGERMEQSRSLQHIPVR